jgi:predicted nuclease of predicted toxin-antitoxin system
MTQDTDFADRSRLYGAPPKVVWLRCGNGTYPTVDDLFADLIEQAQERQAKQTVNAMLRSTLQKIK